MIFGVDEHGHVYWFHPAWTKETDQPTAIAIDTDGKRHELREAIAHSFDGTRLEVHGLFVDRPVTGREVDAVIGKRAAPLGALAIAGAVDHVVTMTVAP